MSAVTEDLVYRLRIRASIRRQAKGRKSVEEGKPDRLADLLDEAAAEIERYRRIENNFKPFLPNRIVQND